MVSTREKTHTRGSDQESGAETEHNNTNTMDTQRSWDRAYDEGFVAQLNECGVAQATFNMLTRNRELLTSIWWAQPINVPEEFIWNHVQKTARHVVRIMYKYTKRHWQELNEENNL